MALKVFEPFELLNRSLQSLSKTVFRMLKAVVEAVRKLSMLRDYFNSILREAQKLVVEFDLDPIQYPRVRKPPKPFSGPCDAHVATSVSDYYRPQFLKMIDTAISQLHELFDHSPGLLKYKQLEEILISGAVTNKELILSYPEP